MEDDPFKVYWWERVLYWIHANLAQWANNQGRYWNATWMFMVPPQSPDVKKALRYVQRLLTEYKYPSVVTTHPSGARSVNLTEVLKSEAGKESLEKVADLRKNL